MGRAQIFFQLKDWERALMDFRKVVELAPESGLGYIGIGDCNVAIGDMKAAINAYTTAKEVDREAEKTALEKRMYLLYKTGDYNLALDDCEKVMLYFLHR
jgi:tetratricopeptide (TPR) repeat protein